MELTDQYQIKISYRFAALENLNYSDNKIRIGKTLNRILKSQLKTVSSLYEQKQHKPWFDEKCSKFVDQRKYYKLEWLQDPSKINADNMNNVTCETSRNFRDKK